MDPQSTKGHLNSSPSVAPMMISATATRISRQSLVKAATVATTGFSLLQLSGVSTSSTLWNASTVHCDQGGGDKDGNNSWQNILDKSTKGLADRNVMDALAKTVGTQIQGAIDTGIPSQLSYGFVSGYCAGIAARQIGRATATVLGLGFITLQTLAYNGYIEVNHTKIQETIEKYMDLNQDGRIDQHDASAAYRKMLKVLEFNLPAGSGFAAGFFGGVRR
ncbi:hypothetical protein MPSEU_001004400 [Mayamaea pseudoterrestris]|nr:hypothetical protein MPSEU_001004400 [Mayamaea pseudoterrestris]